MAITVALTRKKTPMGSHIDAVLKQIPHAKTHVGFPQGDPKAQRLAGEISNASLAAIHNYGSPSQDIPPRPFMAASIHYLNAKNELRTLSRGLLLRIYRNQATIKGSLSIIGEYMTTVIKESIRTDPWRANSSATIARKGSSKPLIDTAQMINAVTHKEVGV